MKPSVTDARKLRHRVDQLVTPLGYEFESKTMVAAALLAKSCDVSNAAAGSLSTMRMLQRAIDLLGGRWSEESIDFFIQQPR